MLSSDKRAFLFSIARQSIEHGLAHGKVLLPTTRDLPDSLSEVRATFVTLKMEQQLRGCIGTTEAIEPLAVSVADNAFSAAFRDPRFEPLDKEEYQRISLDISILTEPEPVSFDSEQELLTWLQPGRDGLIIKKGERRATFLPSVWESLERPEEFLAHLKHKAGLAPGQSVEQAWRYQSEYYEE